MKEFTTNDECGILAQDIASKAISSSFIGTIASTFVLAELLKGLNGGSKIDKMNLDLRSINERIIIKGKEASTQLLAKNGYAIL